MTKDKTPMTNVWKFQGVIYRTLTVILPASLALGTSSGNAQIIPDNTLGTESSTVTTTEPQVQTIDGGAIRGANLFHSFSEFNIGEGNSVYFTNPDGIQNIINRVTGANPSNIFGTLGVSGNANLYLLNPNGIIFGPNASLDIRGSFLGTTASSLLFENGIEFSTNNPQAPPLLTINVPTGLQYNSNPGGIQMQQTQLELQPNQTLGLAGGRISLDGARLLVPGGTVYLSSIAPSQTVPLTAQSNGFVSFPVSETPDLIQKSDISINNSAEINVRAVPGGTIDISAANLEILDGVRIRAGNDSNAIGESTAVPQAGNIIINVSDSVNVADDSLISNAVMLNGSGKGGNIIINAGQLSLSNDTIIGADTFGEGDAGNIEITASEVNLSDGSYITSAVYSSGVGNAGTINITANAVTATEGGRIVASTEGEGNAGDINMNARDRVVFDGENQDIFSGIFSSVAETAIGNGGNITINTGNFVFSNGGRINSEIYGEGNSGNINITATDVLFDSISRNFFRDVAKRPSGAAVTIEEGGIGNSGNINITASTVRVNNGARLSATTIGKGNAGSININADSISFDGYTDDISSTALSNVGVGGEGDGGSVNIDTRTLSLTNGATLESNTLGTGDAGSININATEQVIFDGINPNGNIQRLPGGAFSRVSLPNLFAPTASGNGGSININTGSLFVTGGAVVSASTFSGGDAGTITVNARDRVSFAGTNIRGQSAGAFSIAAGIGDGGRIEISANTLDVTQGASLSTSTEGGGNAGTIAVNVRDTAIFEGLGPTSSSGELATQVAERATGAGGTIEINAGILRLSNGARLNSNSLGTGKAGNIDLQADSIFLDSMAAITADTTAGQGDITVQALDLILRNNSQITTNAQGTATGGNITFNTSNLIALENSDISANAEDSFGGRVIINATGIFGTAFRSSTTPLSDITATSQLGPQFSGSVVISTPEVDPSAGLVPLSQNPIDAASLIANNPCAKRKDSEFIITGRGGLPPTPFEAINPAATDLSWATPMGSGGAGEQGSRGAREQGSRGEEDQETQIVEATGWTVGADGAITLTATAPKTSSDLAITPPKTCNNP
ncbi:MAG TPA: filamentous hemagglutinin N-terminal domain-containing protein [Oscillatoriaceae cyanobacterium M33_DOE_052]|nr:filamentous hemagglutinin N-terminal domain-containing protein [Oscillatoriaceae cyanobacterium M33_DOE_052]